MKKFPIYILLFLLASSCFQNTTDTSGSNSESKGVVNIYTDRHYPIDDSIYLTFEKEYGIKVNVVKGKSEDLLSRIKKEGSSTKADLLITADVGRLHQAKEAQFFQAIDTPEELVNVSPYLYDEENYWFGLTKRARIIVYSNDRVDKKDLSTYEALTDKKWKGRLAIRSKENVYNQSLLASIIIANGEDSSYNWVKGMVKNMYQSPKGNDRDQVKAIYAGKADVAIVNTYYVGKMLNSDDQQERKAAESVSVFYPNQSGRGSHINISGGGVLRHSKNKNNAEKLLNYLLTNEVQELFSKANFEFPVNRNVSISEQVLAWGDFKEDSVKLSEIGKYNTAAIKLFDKGGWK